MNDLLPRAANTCTGSKQWYVCTAGNFRGCCSSDPCTSGVCPDYDEDDASNTSTPESTASVAGLAAVTANIGIPLLSSATTSSSTTSVADSSASSPIPVIVSMSALSTSSDTTTTSEAQAASGTSAATATATTSTTFEATRVTALSSALGVSHISTATPSSESSNSGTKSNRGALIGGVVGGVAGLIICAILLFCCYRRRKRQSKHEKRSSNISWYPYGAARYRYSPKRSSNTKVLSPSDSEGYTATASTTTSQSENRRPSDTPLAMRMGTSHSHNSSSTNLIPNPLRLKSSTNSPIPFSAELAAQVPMPLPHRQGFTSTPELPDTSLYRLRCELASHSQSELINVPIDQRWRQTGPSNVNSTGNRGGKGMPRARESTSSIPLAYTSGGATHDPSYLGRGSGSGNGSGTKSENEGGSPIRQPVGRVITADGVVLGANLDRYSSGMEIGRALERGRDVGPECDDHVMSFMHYGNGNGARVGGEIEMRETVHGRGRLDGGSREGLRSQTVIAALEDDIQVDGAADEDVPPAYDERDGAADPDIKPLTGVERSVRA
ncbi:uncharacterized protein N7511_004244 [Penicillium nucicola]|uniref:uncharacterized protein n=1 Tax=Penicillium nucicola TaxID=1850975 RepID=UPI00254517C3|nr:uncharacterized protein N7511_004244 [Penicillium nucicola]KAJ5766628.1 hypothetical protein N7511_004244 [Penicillium nucicola]